MKTELAHLHSKIEKSKKSCNSKETVNVQVDLSKFGSDHERVTSQKDSHVHYDRLFRRTLDTGENKGPKKTQNVIRGKTALVQTHRTLDRHAVMSDVRVGRL